MQHTYCAIMYLYVVVPCCYPARHSKALGDTNHILSQISTISKAMYASGATCATLLSIVYLKAFATCRKPRGARLENCQLCHWGLHIFATMRVLNPCSKNRWRHCFLATLVFFSCCPRCSMSIHFATTGKSDKRRRNNMCGWNTMFGSNIFQVRSSDIEHIGAYVLRSWCKLRLWRWPPHLEQRPHSLHAPHSQLWQSRNQRYPKNSKELGTCKQHQTTLQDCSFNSPCFRWLTIKSLSWQLGTSTHNFIDKKIPLSSSFFIQVHLLVNYYENITDTEKQKNQTLTFQSLTLVVIGAPQSGTSFYLSAANTFTLLSSFSLCVHSSARGLLLYSACTDGNYSILFDLFITIPQISTIVLSHAPTNINRLAGPGWASFQAILE